MRKVKYMKNNYLNLLVVTATLGTLYGCSVNKDGAQVFNLNSAQQQDTKPIVAVDPGLNADVVGVGSASAPVAQAAVARIENGLEGKVSHLKGNFATILTQVSSNLPKTQDPTKVTGLDQVALASYAACSDITPGTAGLMNTIYKVDSTKTIAVNKPALIAAGVRIVDQYVGGLASTGALAASVSQAFSALVDADALVAGETSQIAFISVCQAATFYGVGMRGI